MHLANVTKYQKYFFYGKTQIKMLVEEHTTSHLLRQLVAVYCDLLSFYWIKWQQNKVDEAFSHYIKLIFETVFRDSKKDNVFGQ